MNMEINVGASELEKGAEGIRDALNEILQNAEEKTHLITFVFNKQTSWFKVDLTKPDDAQIVYFNESHRSLLAPLKVVFDEFLSQFPKGNLLDWDRHNRTEHSLHQTPYLNNITKEFVEKTVRVNAERYPELSILSTKQVKKVVEQEVIQSPSRFGFGFFSVKPPAEQTLDKAKKNEPTQHNK